MTGISARIISSFLFEEVSAAPLKVFRFAFGIMMFLSTLRFMLNGWVDALYVQPKFFFTFYGFEWVRPLSETGMYVVFALLLISSLLIAFGWFYRLSIVAFFLLFTYVELIDKSNYLNHYYFISIVSFLLCLLPSPAASRVPRWAILTIQLQMAVVYFFAGIAKINADWLLNAMPLKIWLASKTDLPLVGSWLGEDWLAFVFSWCGMLFDVCIAFLLFNRRTVWAAYTLVIIFHSLTAILFPMIGVFPFVMMVCATIFLPKEFHEKLVRTFSFGKNEMLVTKPAFKFQQVALAVLCIHFLVQLVLPFRYLLYPDKLFYHEEGYRFSWRVMLMEKAGHVFYIVKSADGQLIEINSRNFLTMQQEKQMSTQPDMILQFSQYLKERYQATAVYAEAYVTVNGRASRLLIDPTINLAEEVDGFAHKKWILAQAK